MNEVMELISKIVLESREDEAALYNISEEGGELEKQYTDAITRASTVLAQLSNYNSARASEVTGVPYTRDPEKVRASWCCCGRQFDISHALSCATGGFRLCAIMRYVTPLPICSRESPTTSRLSLICCL